MIENILKSLIKDLISTNDKITIYDKDHIPVFGPSSDPQLIFDNLRTTEEAYLVVPGGWVRLMYDNKPTEVLNNWSLTVEKTIKSTLDMIQEYDNA